MIRSHYENSFDRFPLALVHSLISLNGHVVAQTEARLEAVTGIALYGRGVWTTLAIHAGAPFLWREHWARLIAHAEAINVDYSSLHEADVYAHLAAIIGRNKVAEGRARLSLLARRASGLWREPNDRGAPSTDVLIMTGERRAISQQGLALTVSPYRLNTLSPLAGLKTSNYLDHILPWEEARARHFDEAVMLNERGEIVSATLANIFWTTDGTLHTPALACGALAGTTRSLVIELAAELAMPVVEGAYDISHLADADEIFLTSAGLGLAFCSVFDFRRYTLHAGSAVLRLSEAVRQRTLQVEG